MNVKEWQLLMNKSAEEQEFRGTIPLYDLVQKTCYEKTTFCVCSVPIF